MLRGRSRRTGGACRGRRTPGKKNFSKSFLASTDWYAGLARLCGGGFTAAAMIGLADEINRGQHSEGASQAHLLQAPDQLPGRDFTLFLEVVAGTGYAAGRDPLQEFHGSKR
jgi:hypothetical protein